MGHAALTTQRAALGADATCGPASGHEASGGRGHEGPSPRSPPEGPRVVLRVKRPFAVGVKIPGPKTPTGSWRPWLLSLESHTSPRGAICVPPFSTRTRDFLLRRREGPDDRGHRHRPAGTAQKWPRCHFPRGRRSWAVRCPLPAEASGVCSVTDGRDADLHPGLPQKALVHPPAEFMFHWSFWSPRAPTCHGWALGRTDSDSGTDVWLFGEEGVRCEVVSRRPQRTRQSCAGSVSHQIRAGPGPGPRGPPQPGCWSPGEEEQRSELCWRWEGGVRSAPHHAVWVAYDSGSAWRERKGNSG